MDDPARRAGDVILEVRAWELAGPQGYWSLNGLTRTAAAE